MPVARGGLRAFLHQRRDSGELRLSPEQEEAVAFWRENVWNFCTGVWPLPRHAGAKGSHEPKPIVWTQDKLRHEVRPFPASFEYLRDCVLEPIFHAPRTAEDGSPFKLRAVIPKPRQIFCTNGILVGCLWDVLFHEATEWLIAKNKAPEAERFVKERVRFTYSRLPEWFAGISGPRSRLGWRTVPHKPAGRFEVRETGSKITPVSRTFGESGEAIGETADVLLDECIRLRGLRAVWAAADAQAPRMVAVSAPPERGARVDPDSVAFMRELMEGLPEGTLAKTVVGLEPADDDGDDPDDTEDVSAFAGEAAIA